MGKLSSLSRNWYSPQWWTRTVLPYYYEKLLYGYFEYTAPDGFDLMSEDWDICYILDACRYDMFADLHPFDGDLDCRNSHASSTPGFLEANFGEGTYHDTVYVTANPMHAVDEWCDVDLAGVFHAVVDVWKTAWDTEVGTVPPGAMANAVEEAAETYPNKRILAHFVQPHHPFIGPSGQSLTETGMRGREKALNPSADVSGGSSPNVWELLERGAVSKRRVWRAYNENLELTLPHLEHLLDTVRGRTVITSDHGNLVGEVLWPFPKRGYGHPVGLLAPQLVEVPWLVVDTGSRRKVEPDRPVEPQVDHESVEVEERLERLGYYPT